MGRKDRKNHIEQTNIPMSTQACLGEHGTVSTPVFIGNALLGRCVGRQCNGHLRCQYTESAGSNSGSALIAPDIAAPDCAGLPRPSLDQGFDVIGVPVSALSHAIARQCRYPAR